MNLFSKTTAWAAPKHHPHPSGEVALHPGTKALQVSSGPALAVLGESRALFHAASQLRWGNENRRADGHPSELQALRHLLCRPLLRDMTNLGRPSSVVELPRRVLAA